MLTKINIFQKNFNAEKKNSMYYILSKELLRKYKECFLYKNLIPFIKGTNFNKLTSDSDIFDFIKTIPNNLILLSKELFLLIFYFLNKILFNIINLSYNK